MQKLGKDSKPTYFEELKRVAPAFALKAVAGDLPKAAIEKGVKLKLTPKEHLPKHLRGAGTKAFIRESFRGSAVGRTAGGITGVLTAPAFVKGMELAQSNKKSDKRKGLALIGGSAAAYQLQKGGLDEFKELAGKPLKKRLAGGAAVGLTRALYKTPSALAFGSALASARKSKGKKGGKLESTLKPALYGAVSAGGGRAIEKAVKDRHALRAAAKKHGLGKALRRLVPPTVGGVVGGAAGGLVIDKVLDSLKKKK
jgi:hypothetical protein